MMSNETTRGTLERMHQLLTDPDCDFIERKNVQTSLLELNDHKEIPICNIIAWLFNAKEGHLQGDIFLKALLNGIYQTADKTQRQKMPSISKMLMLPLSRFTIMTEVAIRQSKDRRIDILMADTSSKTVIVFERKDGSYAHDGQLKDYHDWTEKNFAGWEKIYVLSDSFEKNHGEEHHQSFIQLDDTWLTTILLDLIQRENLTNRLEYIFRDLHDFIFDSFDEKRDPFYRGLDKRSKRLVHNHIELTRELADFNIVVSGETKKILSITPNFYFTHLSTFNNELSPVTFEILALIQAHYDLFNLLSHYTGFEFIEDEIQKRFPYLKTHLIENELCLINEKHGLDEDYSWPYALTIERKSDDESQQDYYRAYISANKRCSEKELDIAEIFAKINEFKMKSNWKYKQRVVVDNISSLSISGGLLKAIDDFYKKSCLI